MLLQLDAAAAAILALIGAPVCTNATTAVHGTGIANTAAATTQVTATWCSSRRASHDAIVALSSSPTEYQIAEKQ